MKTSADLKALLGDINTEVAEKRAAEEAARAAEVKEKIGVVMQLLPLVTASTKAVAAVRDQMYSVPEVKTAVRDYLRKEFLESSGNLLPNTAAQIAAAVGELGELSTEKSTEIRKKNEAVYEHRKTAHGGTWKHGCPECALMFVQESRADGATHRYIAVTHWAGALLKERYDLNRPKLMPKGQVGPIGKAMQPHPAQLEVAPVEDAPKLPSRKVRRAGNPVRATVVVLPKKQQTTHEEDASTGRPAETKQRGGAGSDEAARAMRGELPVE